MAPATGAARGEPRTVHQRHNQHDLHKTGVNKLAGNGIKKWRVTPMCSEFAHPCFMKIVLLVSLINCAVFVVIFKSSKGVPGTAFDGRDVGYTQQDLIRNRYINKGSADAVKLVQSGISRERIYFSHWPSFRIIYINKNVNVTLFVIGYLRNFFTDCFEIWTQLCSRNRE
jgi:hypothetical protein